MTALMTIKLPERGFSWTFYPVRQADALKAKADARALAQVLDAAVGNDALTGPARDELPANALARAELLEAALGRMFAEPT